MTTAIVHERLKVQVKLAKEFQGGNKHGDDVPVYNTTSENRGVVKIINVIFDDSRRGSEIDVENLHALFDQMGFQVIIHPKQACTKQGINDALESFVQDPALKGADIAMLFIMSHGSRINGRDVFYTSDKKYFYYDDVRSYFLNNKCKQMKGKPKMIFFQTCRGNTPDFGQECTSAEIDSILIPTCTDLLIATATIPDSVAIRWPTVGSLFVNNLCMEFMNWAHERDVLTMMHHVYTKMSRERIQYKGNIIMQTGDYTNTNFGRCYLNPGIYRDREQKMRYFAERNICEGGCNSRADLPVSPEQLHKYAMEGNVDKCLELLEKGVDINCKNQQGLTPLCMAAFSGSYSTCIALLKKNANVHVRTNERYSPLHYAAIRGHKHIYDLLVQYGADEDGQNQHNETPKLVLAQYS